MFPLFTTVNKTEYKYNKEVLIMKNNRKENNGERKFKGYKRLKREHDIGVALTAILIIAAVVAVINALI
jgi:lipopolysaccharide/colanic/teichoic acid biosynthesis glycosyltransferase